MIGSDREFLSNFHNRSLNRFSHRDHLRLAWILMKEHGSDEGLDILRGGIKDLAKDQGASSRYHETLTVFWARVVHHAIQAGTSIANFDTFLASYPILLDKNLPGRHWSSELLWDQSAREKWVDPDIKPMP